MAEYIDREKVLDGIKELLESPWANGNYANYIREGVEVVRELCIKQEPTIDVVRCRDCIHSDEMEAHGVEAYRLCKIMGRSVRPDFFCADGRNGNE